MYAGVRRNPSYLPGNSVTLTASRGVCSVGRTEASFLDHPVNDGRNNGGVASGGDDGDAGDGGGGGDGGDGGDEAGGDHGGEANQWRGYLLFLSAIPALAENGQILNSELNIAEEEEIDGTECEDAEADLVDDDDHDDDDDDNDDDDDVGGYEEGAAQSTSTPNPKKPRNKDNFICESVLATNLPTGPGIPTKVR